MFLNIPSYSPIKLRYGAYGPGVQVFGYHVKDVTRKRPVHRFKLRVGLQFLTRAGHVKKLINALK